VGDRRRWEGGGSRGFFGDAGRVHAESNVVDGGGVGTGDGQATIGVVSFVAGEFGLLRNQRFGCLCAVSRRMLLAASESATDASRGGSRARRTLRSTTKPPSLASSARATFRRAPVGRALHRRRAVEVDMCGRDPRPPLRATRHAPRAAMPLMGADQCTRACE
jgi:hypothetical protein